MGPSWMALAARSDELAQKVPHHGPGRRKRYFTPTEARIVMVLESLGQDAVCSKAELALACNVDVKTVDRTVRALRVRGVIEVSHHYDKSGRQLANSYHLTPAPNLTST